MGAVYAQGVCVCKMQTLPRPTPRPTPPPYLPCRLQVLGRAGREDDLAQAESREQNLPVAVHGGRDENRRVSHAKHATFISTQQGDSDSARVKGG